MNECKKADVNGKEVTVLGVIHTENINNWEQLKETSNWINIDLVDYLNEQEASNLSFSFSDQIHLRHFQIQHISEER